jgi:hypothetical protein
MTALTWDDVGERRFETGVDHGVLYHPDETGAYGDGEAWNGLTTVTESPSGAAATPLYADNIKYLNLIAAESFEATIEAFTYPDSFAECDGTVELTPGVFVGQQSRKLFGLAYRTRIGNDIDGQDHGYRLHLVYGALAAPSQKAYATVNDSPAAIAFSWTVSTTPVAVTDNKPTALLTIDSTKVDATRLAALLDILYGTVGDDPRLPLPNEVLTIMTTGETDVDLRDGAKQPSFVDATGVLTLPAVTGVQWRINGANVTSGVKPAIAAGASIEVDAVATSGYNLVGNDHWTFERDA